MELEPPNELAREMVQHIKKRGEAFKYAVVSHMKTISKHEGKRNQMTMNECIQYCIARLFLKTMELQPIERVFGKVNENSAWPVPILPMELFGPDTKQYRVGRFKKLLKLNDVLDCKLKEMTPADNPFYNLQVIHKLNSTQILQDLNIEAKLKKKATNALLLGKKLTSQDYVRVAVINFNDEEIFVTVSGKNVGDVKNMGKILATDLPSYVQNPSQFEKFSSYASYLKSFSQYGNFHLLDDICNGFGVDTKMSFSFTPICCGKIGDEQTGQEVLKILKERQAEKSLHSAKTKRNENKFQDALDHIKIALKNCPQGKDQLKSQMHQCRGDLYVKANIGGNLKCAVAEWITAFTLNQDTETQKQLCIILGKISKRYRARKQYGESIKYAEAVLKILPDNAKATKIIEYVKKKQPEIFPACDVQTLQERKKAIVSELTRADRERAEEFKRKYSKKRRL